MTAGSIDLTSAKPLAENEGLGFSGITKKKAFDVPGEVARQWLDEPTNPNGVSNAAIVSPWVSWEGITGRPRDWSIINFGDCSESEASFFSAPFSHVSTCVRPVRSRSSSDAERRDWWKLARRAPPLFQAMRSLSRLIATPEVSKHRVFSWVPVGTTLDKNLVAIMRDDDTAFGILQSRFHEAWALRFGTSLEDRPRYTSSTTFRTFPFPPGLAPNTPAAAYVDDPRAQAIAAAARALVEARDRWLNPPDLVERVPEAVPGLPGRVRPRDAPRLFASAVHRAFTPAYKLRNCEFTPSQVVCSNEPCRSGSQPCCR